jgi:hypothetical protein
VGYYIRAFEKDASDCSEEVLIARSSSTIGIELGKRLKRRRHMLGERDSNWKASHMDSKKGPFEDRDPEQKVWAMYIIRRRKRASTASLLAKLSALLCMVV